MPSSLDASRLTPALLDAALRNLPSRPAALLRRRLVLRESLEACAAFYGVPAESFSLHLLREALALTAAAGGSTREPASAEEEAAWAWQLSSALEREATSVSPALRDTVALCRRLLATGSEVEAARVAAERLLESSPRRQREELLRRLAVGLLLALAAYLHWSNSPL